MGNETQRNSDSTVDDASLAAFVRQHAPDGVELRHVVVWVDQLADALDRLYESGRHHGDVSPHTVILDAGDRARLAGTGRPGATGDARRHDLVQLAATCYVALSGEMVLDRFEDLASGEPTSLPPVRSVSNQVNAALRAALAPDPNTRPTRPREFVQTLQGAPVRGAPPVPTVSPPRPRRTARAFPVPIVAAAGAALIVIVLVGWLILGRDGEPAPTPAPPAGQQVLARPEPKPLDLPDRRAAEQSALVSELASALETTLSTIGAPERTIVAQETTEIRSLVTAGRTALADGDLSLAEEHLRAARMRVNALPELERNADDAAAARARWEASAAEVPAVVAQPLRERLAEVQATAGVAQSYEAAGELAEARTTWDDATLALLAIVEQSETARCAADDGAEQWRQAENRAPTAWLDDHQVREPLDRARGLAAQSEADSQAGRFEAAAGGYREAAKALDDATDRHADGISRRAADVASATGEGRFDDAFATLDDLSPFVEPEWTNRQRIAVHLDRARRSDRTERDAAMQSLDAILALDADHAEARALREKVSAMFAAQAGDELTNGIDMRFVFLPPGEFVMGRDDAARRDIAAHPVRLTNGFWMSRTEVTRGQFDRFVRLTDHRTDAEAAGWAHGLDDAGRWQRTEGLTWREPGFAQTGEHPVVCVSYDDAVAFCRWLSELEGRTYRLPTEAEWEYACRAGTTTAYAWGDGFTAGAGFGNATDERWREAFGTIEVFPWNDGYVYTSPAGAFRGNDWALHDMQGNAQEWCLDRYGPYADALAVDPGLPADDGSDRRPRVIRGGSFAAPPPLCRADHRDASTPDSCFATYGFRVVLEERP